MPRKKNRRKQRQAERRALEAAEANCARSMMEAHIAHAPMAAHGAALAMMLGGLSGAFDMRRDNESDQIIEGNLDDPYES